MIFERLRSLWLDTRGSALLEATVLTPVLFVLVFGVYEFSWYFYRQHLVAIGVRDAARYLARTNYDNPCNSSAHLVTAKNIATKTPAGTPRVSGWVSDNVSIVCKPLSQDVCGTTTPCEVNSGYPDYYVYIVTVSTSYTPSPLGFMGFLGLTAPKIVASHGERAVGQG